MTFRGEVFIELIITNVEREVTNKESGSCGGRERERGVGGDIIKESANVKYMYLYIM